MWLCLTHRLRWYKHPCYAAEFLTGDIRTHGFLIHMIHIGLYSNTDVANSLTHYMRKNINAKNSSPSCNQKRPIGRENIYLPRCQTKLLYANGLPCYVYKRMLGLFSSRYEPRYNSENSEHASCIQTYVADSLVC